MSEDKVDTGSIEPEDALAAPALGAGPGDDDDDDDDGPGGGGSGGNIDPDDDEGYDDDDEDEDEEPLQVAPRRMRQNARSCRAVRTRFAAPQQFVV